MVISDHALRSDEVVFERECAGGRPRRHAELREDVLQVSSDRVLADHQSRRDLAVALSFRHQPQHLELAGRQPVGLDGVAAARERIHRSHRRRSAELLEGRARSVELELESVFDDRRATWPELANASMYCMELTLFVIEWKGIELVGEEKSAATYGPWTFSSLSQYSPPLVP